MQKSVLIKRFLFKAMRITVMQFFLAALFCGLSTAHDTHAQELLSKEISIKIESAEVKNVLQQIEKQAGIIFIYSTNSIQAKKKVSLTIKNGKLSEVLDRLLVPLQITYEVEGTRILLQKKTNDTSLIPESTIDKTITGKVSDDKGEALPGVSVVIKGTQRGTTTNSDGAYQLNVPEQTATLIFSFVGYLPQEKIIENESVINIKLATDTKSLEEVVVVGYGTQKRANVTSAISSVPMGEIKDMPISNLGSALQGKIAGVVIQQNNGAPGSTPAIKIRGFGSISAGTSPLVVVDGNIVGSGVFGMLNSNDIESMDVLKDASSTAIYGSKGSNGVILVTTKRGKAGKTNVNFDVYTGFQEISKKVDLLNSQQFAEYSKEAANTAYVENVPGAKASDANSIRPSSYLRYRYPRGESFDWLDFDDPAKVANLPYHDFQDLIFRKAKMSNYQLSVSGGSEKARYLVSGGYLTQEGIINKSKLDRYTLRANVEIDVLPKLKVGMNLNPSFKSTQEVNSEGHWSNMAIITAALSSIPMAPIYAADGTYTSQLALAAPYNYPGVTNPVANITEYNSQYLTTNLLANAYAEYKFLKNFTYRVSGNVNFNGNRRNAYRTSKMPQSNILPPATATGTAFSDQALSYLFNQTVNFSKSINEIHNFDVLIGMETTKYQYQMSNATGSSYANDVVETLNGSASGSTTTATSSRTENSSTSYFARANYNYKGKYLANVSVRRDGSSVFGPDNRWGTFPAGSLGWRINEENFMKNITSLSETKLRASYGLSGNNAFTDNYPYVGTLKSDNYVFGNALNNGLAPSTLGNSKLGWERNQQFDLGLDLGLFSNRIYLIVDYYRRITKDLLLSVNVPTLTGYNSAFKNIGKMENKGWEFSLNTRNLTKAFTWNTNLNISFNRNKVLALGPNGDPIRSTGQGAVETSITQIGSPIGSFYGYKQIGIFQNQTDLDSHPHDATSRPGDVKYEDVNADGKITAADRTIIGNNQPDYIYGFTNTFAYKGFDLNIAFQGTQGGEIMNLGRRFFDNVEGNQNQLTTVLSRWKSESEPGDGKTPRANARTTGTNNAVSSRWVEDGSYLRIQNISLGYKLPSSWLNKAKVQQARIYVSAQNLHTWTKYLNYNPEVSNYEGPLTGGVDYGTYPLAKTFTVGINVGF